MSKIQDVREIKKIPRIFPVNIQSVEFIFSQEIDSLVDELIHPECITGKFFEGCRTECPSSDRK